MAKEPEGIAQRVPRALFFLVTPEHFDETGSSDRSLSESEICEQGQLAPLAARHFFAGQSVHESQPSERKEAEVVVAQGVDIVI